MLTMLLNAFRGKTAEKKPEEKPEEVVKATSFTSFLSQPETQKLVNTWDGIVRSKTGEPGRSGVIELLRVLHSHQDMKTDDDIRESAKGVLNRLVGEDKLYIIAGRKFKAAPEKIMTEIKSTLKGAAKAIMGKKKEEKGPEKKKAA